MSLPFDMLLQENVDIADFKLTVFPDGQVQIKQYSKRNPAEIVSRHWAVRAKLVDLFSTDTENLMQVDALTE